MENKNLRTSARMAMTMGIFLPLAETARRIHEILAFQNFFRWFDDYTLGAVLLFAAIRSSGNKPKGTEMLIAAWGMAAGGLTLSFYGQLSDYFQRIPDPGIFSSGLVAVVKGLILVFILIGLYYSVKAPGASTKK